LWLTSAPISCLIACGRANCGSGWRVPGVEGGGLVGLKPYADCKAYSRRRATSPFLANPFSCRFTFLVSINKQPRKVL
jgi:hypothetical protein